MVDGSDSEDASPPEDSSPDDVPASLAGRLLVAEPTLADGNFHRTVVYLIEHDVGGALGVVLNRPGQLPAREVVPEWAPYVSEPAQIFVGGPVSPERAICLGRRRGHEPMGTDVAKERSAPDAAPSEAEGPTRVAGLWQPLTESVGGVDLHGDPLDAPPGIEDLRIFAGYAGWSAGQLEGELSLGGWYVVDADDDDLFTADPSQLWRRVLARQTGVLRSLSRFPADPTMN